MMRDNADDIGDDDDDMLMNMMMMTVMPSNPFLSCFLGDMYSTAAHKVRGLTMSISS